MDFIYLGQALTNLPQGRKISVDMHLFFCITICNKYRCAYSFIQKYFFLLKYAPQNNSSFFLSYSISPIYINAG